MRTPKFVIMQGSTPTIDVEIPLDVSGGGCKVYLDIIQGDEIVLEYTMNGTQAPADIRPTGTLVGDVYEGTLLILSMTQADTLRLDEGDAAIQLRYISALGDADTTIPVFGFVGKAYKSGVIS